MVGDGPAARGLQQQAGPHIKFAGRQPDAAVAEILSTARALIVTSVEEFGIAAVEAQAAGRPVIARGEGGVLETVIEGRTGHLWTGGPSELAQAVREFDTAAVDSDACIHNAARFDVASFRRAMFAQVEAAIGEGSRRGGDRQPLPTARLVRRAARDR